MKLVREKVFVIIIADVESWAEVGKRRRWPDMPSRMN